jgi:hypothetical protein
MAYDNRHRTFLQAVMHAGTILDQDAVVLCVKIFGKIQYIIIKYFY